MPLQCYDIKEALKQSLIDAYNNLPYLESIEDVRVVLPHVFAVIRVDLSYGNDMTCLSESIIRVHDKNTARACFIAEEGWCYDCYHSVDDNLILWVKEYNGSKDKGAYTKLPRNPNMSDNYRLDKFWVGWPYHQHGLQGRLVYELTPSTRRAIIDTLWERTRSQRATHEKRVKR